MKYIPVMLLFFGCVSPHTESIDDVVEKAMKEKEGVDIRIDPIKEDGKH